MIEVTFRIESLDYTDKLDSQLPLVLEALSQSGNINPVLKLACNTPEASSRIVKGILQLHQAKFGVESKLGEGSTFWFELKTASAPQTKK